MLSIAPLRKYNKLLLQSVGDLTESEKILTEDGIHSLNSWKDTRLVGGLWGGSTTTPIQALRIKK